MKNNKIILILKIILVISALAGLIFLIHYLVAKDTKQTSKQYNQNCPLEGGEGGGGNFPLSVIILDPKDTDQVNQEKVDKVWKEHGEASALHEVQFGPKRTLILLKPGKYDIIINVAYYMSVAGLGKSPADVTVSAVLSHPSTDTEDKGHSTQCFWRSVENISITPSSIVKPENTNTWSVSQAAPMRRVICNGNLSLVDNSTGGQDWASGGFIADSLINGPINSWGQQQWFTRNTTMSNWPNLNMWNYVFSGCEFGKDVKSSCGEGKNVYVIEKTPLIAQKPTLFFDPEDGKYKVLRPHPSKNTSGTPDWKDGDVISLSQFYITKPNDTAKTINDAIKRKLHIFLSPGIYDLDDSIIVSNNCTMILGYGMPTLVAKDKPAIIVNNVDNVVVSGIIFSVAGGGKVSSLLLWGTKKESHPGFAYDIFTRVGGDTNENTFCDKMVVINSDNVIGDNFWLWRADHGNGVGWEKNVANNALEVNGDNCIIYALAGEHTQKDIVVWNGDNGSVYFYQSEMAYDGGYGGSDYDNNVVSYRVRGKQHKAFGLGAYGFYGVPDSDLAKRAVVKNAFVTPDDAKMENVYIMNASFAGGGFTNVINGKGKGLTARGEIPKFSYVCSL